MAPKTHAMIKYWLITISYIPKALYLAVLGGWYEHKLANYTHVAEWERYNEKLEALKEEVKCMVFHRRFETEREYKFRVRGYELIIK